MSLLKRVQVSVPDRYRIDSEIGRGGMSVVFGGVDLTLGCPIAVKVLKPELATAEGAARFLREARTLANLKHPNVLSVHEVGEWGGLYFMVTDLVEGASLATRSKLGPMPVAEVRAIGVELLDALSLVHGAQVVHRDIKPGNILMVHGHPVLADFGIARVAGYTDEPLTREGVTPGTPEYMAPEVVRGEPATPRSDLYGLAAVLYECVAGRRWDKAMSGAWKDVPSGMTTVLKKALAERPADRWTDAESFRAALEGRPARPVLRWLVPLAGAAIAAAVVLGSRIPQPVQGDRPSSPMVVLVAPFEDLSPDATLTHIADGLNRDITNIVGQSTRLTPIGRITARSLEGQPIDLTDLRRELRVDYVLEGSLQGDETALRVSLALTSTADHTVLWSDSFEFDRREQLRQQDEIAALVLLELENEVGGEPPVRTARHQTDDPRAWEAYQIGRAAWEERRAEVIAAAALPQFHRALALDSTYALAWAGIADVYNVLGSYDYGAMPPRFAFDRARQAAETAVRLQPELAEGWTALANTIFNRDWDLDAAERAYQEALARTGEYSAAHQWYSIVLRVRGNSEAALTRARRAAALDRRSPIARIELGRLHYLDHDYASSRSEYRAAIELDPNFAPAHLGLGHSLVMDDSIGAGLVHLEHGLRLTNHRASLGWALMGYARAKAGDSVGADEAFEALRSLDVPYVPPEHVSVIHLGRGELAAAVDSLASAWRAGSNVVLFYHFEPLLDVLRGHSGFEALVDSIGIVDQL